MRAKVILRAVVSSLLAITILSQIAAAHEVQPGIADLRVTGDRLDIQLEAMLEPMIAEIDLNGLEDTNASDRSHVSDALRALPPEELEQEIRDWFPTFARNLHITSGGVTVTPNWTAS